jgi:tetratricopeptide (TPR) repeat protein
MVLNNKMKRILALNIFFTVFISGVYAADVNTNIKKMQISLDKNNLENVEEIYDNNEETLSKNWMALERLALSFERRNKFKEAIDVYRKLITNFNFPAHKKIVESSDSPVVESLYNTNKLPYYYYKLAFLNAQLFVSSNKFMPEADRIKYKRNAEGYIGLLKKVNTDSGEIKLIEEMISEKIKSEDQLSYKSNWYLFLDVISWQDRVYLKNMATGSKSNLLSTAIGSSLGAGKKWSNSRYEFNVEGQYTVATSTISNDGAGPAYLQSSVPVKSIIAGPGMYYKGFSDKVYVGIQVPFSYRTGDWEVPAGYTFENDKQFGAGYFLQVKFMIGSIAIQTRLGKIFPNPACHWSIGALYDF